MGDRDGEDRIAGDRPRIPPEHELEAIDPGLEALDPELDATPPIGDRPWWRRARWPP
jgi:hypothetical protein